MTKRAIYSKISACKSSCWSTLTWILGQLSTANQQHMHALTISYQFKTERDSYSEIGASRSSWLLPRLWIIWLMTEWGINFPSSTKLSSKWVWTHSLPTNRWSSGLWKYSVIYRWSVVFLPQLVSTNASSNSLPWLALPNHT